MGSIDGHYPALPAPLEMPLGKSMLLLSVFDTLRAADRCALPEHYLRLQLNESSNEPVSDDAFRTTLEQLESEGYLSEATCPEVRVIKAPEIPGVELSLQDVRLYSPTDAEPGDRCWALVPTHHKTARACRQLHSGGGVWLLGGHRILDQLLLCFELSRLTIDDIDSELWTFPSKEVLAAVQACVESGLVSEKTGEYQLTRDGQIRRSELQSELSKLSWQPFTSKSSDTPLRPECRALLDALSEKQLCENVLVPLLRSMGFQQVTYNNGPGENGKDIVAFKNDELGLPQWLAIVAKAKDISGNASGNSGSTTVTNQIQEALEHSYADPRTGDRVRMSRCWVVSSGKILTTATDKFNLWLDSKPSFRPLVRFLGQEHLLDLLAERRPETFDELKNPT